MIIDLLGDTVDLSKIVRVGPVGGDPTWKRYTIYFVGGDNMVIYEDRQGECFPREKLVELWRMSVDK